ncbi:MAG TPA: hypothetical protein DEA43_05010 [Candidatus Moranbacteria bacterium]|nr:hypothetical protein [Candidatus Moranbacteria bacterium]HBT46211.1 hypothetical protein [Candidatus Moranbacteria bacterium]
MHKIQKIFTFVAVFVFGISLFSGQAFAGNLNCGTANGSYFLAAPTENLCSVGTASVVNTPAPWTWTCTDALCTDECISDCIAYQDDGAPPIITSTNFTTFDATYHNNPAVIAAPVPPAVTVDVFLNAFTDELSTCIGLVTVGENSPAEYSFNISAPSVPTLDHVLDFLDWGDLIGDGVTVVDIICTDEGGNVSAPTTVTFSVLATETVATPVADPVGGTFPNAQVIYLSSTTADATIYYTINGSAPTTGSLVYDAGGVDVYDTTTIKAIAVKAGMIDSAVMTEIYTIGVVPVDGVCGSADGVAVSTAPATNLCSAGTATTPAGTGPWTWSCTGTDGGTDDSCSAPLLELDQVVAPTSSPAAGTYTSVQSVTLSSATSGTTIYYTIDGSTPTTSSTLYSSAISIGSTTTLKAIAVKSGMTNSTVMSSAYTISLPTATVGNVSAGIDKTVSSVTALSGSATGTGITYAWTKQSGPGSLVFGSASSATTTVSANTDGMYIVRLTATDSSGASAYDDMYLTWDTSFPYAEFVPFETTDTTPQIIGTYTGSPVGITLYIGSYSFPAAINENGTWRVVDNTITPALSKNTYSVRIRAFDLAGNTSDNYANLKITDSDSSSSSSSDDNDSDEEKKNSKQIRNSKKTVKSGDYIVQSGKNFPKKSKVLVYFQRNNESYYPPKVVYTDSKGKFSIKYKVNKPKGVYNWFVQDYKSGKKVWSKYRVR